MMDAFIATAIIGTGQQSNQTVSTGTPVDALAEQLEQSSTERKLLLMAGAAAVYHLAGYTAHTGLTLPTPAEPESLPVCSPEIARYIGNMLEEKQQELLPEFLAQLTQSGLRLPFNLLFQALTYGTKHKNIREALIPTLGQRGPWLSQFNSAWSWVKEQSNASSEDLETQWQEGTLAQRVQVLRHLRTIDTGKARSWLQEVWKQEIADARRKLLATFEVGLSPADETFLEQALDDLRESVRITAASLLTRLPSSALVQRMTARADKMLSCQENSSLKESVLSIAFPKELDEAWKRDMPGLKSQDASRRTLWLKQTLATVPLKHWTEHFSTSLMDLTSSAEKSEWCSEIIESWLEAALRDFDHQWILQLMHCSLEQAKEAEKLDVAYYQHLIEHLPQDLAEQSIIHIMDLRSFWSSPTTWTLFLLALPKPWSKNFSQWYLQELNKHAQVLLASKKWDHDWCQGLELAALSIHPSCLNQAVISWDPTDNIHFYGDHLIENVQELVLTRKHLYEEFKAIEKSSL
jgi:hypothetical protein